MRDKKAIAELVTTNQPFLYTSGKYPSEFEKTAVVVRIADHPKRQGALVYDLRHDPTPFAELSAAELAEAWRWRKPDEPGLRLPVKTLQYNRCPAIAPLGVLDDASKKRLQIDTRLVQSNLKKLHTLDFVPRLLEALEILDAKQQTSFLQDEQEVDARLYDGFIGDADKATSRMVRSAGRDELANLEPHFKDDRLSALLPLYKARNFPGSLSDEERVSWEQFRTRKLLGGKQTSRLAKYFNRLAELAAKPDITSKDQYILEELQLYGQSIMPVETDF